MNDFAVFAILFCSTVFLALATFGLAYEYIVGRRRRAQYRQRLGRVINDYDRRTTVA